ncbi:MAG: LytTR family transcriptional regulator [Clostridium sp.]|nr:LytTR family transcriptional regulator [Clostridium sp.]
MKISFWIHEKFKEPEIVICGAEKTRELAELKQIIAEAVDEKITVYDERDAVQITQSEIIRFFASRQRVYAQTADATYLVRARLYELEETLKKQFVRISNSEIVNAKKIRRMDTSIAGTIHMYLQGEIETYVSRRYMSRIKESLMW